MSGFGFGAGGFGVMPWGGVVPATFDLIDAYPIAENILRLTFSEPPYQDGIGGIGDALDPDHYVTNLVPGGIGIDGKPVRSVLVINSLAVEGRLDQIDVMVDRPFSPYPCQYQITVAGLVGTLSGLPIITSMIQFDGLLRTIENASRQNIIRNRDIASPQVPSDTLDPLPNPSAAILGSFNADVSGDYAFDEGLTGYRKRIFRRIYCRKRHFVFLPPDWGLGITDRLKRLGTTAEKESIRVEMEEQIKQEPETKECSVTLILSKSAPSVVRYKIHAVTKDGRELNTTLPFSF